MLYVSPQVEEILGFTPDEWIADPIAWARQFHPDDRDPHPRGLRPRSSARAGRFRAEYRMYARDRRRSGGSATRPSSCATTPASPRYWQGIMFDVTANARDEERADANRRSGTGRSSSRSPRSSTGRTSRGDALEVVYINPRVEELLGITPEEWIARPERLARRDPPGRSRARRRRRTAGPRRPASPS